MTSIAVEEEFIGAGKVLIDGVFAGDTREDNVFRIIQEKSASRLNGVRGVIAEQDYIDSEMAELDMTLVSLAADRLPLYIPGSVATAQYADGVLAGGGGDTTLAASAAIGATNFKVTAVTNFAIGDIVQIGPTGSTREFRKVTAVGTAGGGGTGIDVDVAAVYAHGNTELFQEVASTTLAADSAIGAVNLKVASVTGLAVGDYVQFGYPGERETRRLTFVGTTGAGGTGVSFDSGLTRAHRSGDPLYETTNDGTTLVEAGANRRLAATDYHSFELQVAGSGTRLVRFVIPKGLNTANPEFAGRDTGGIQMGPRLTVQSRINKANIEASPWQIYRSA